MVNADTTSTPEDLTAARVAIPQTVVYRTFVHETIVLNLETGLYHGLNSTGGKMLDTLRAVGVIGDAARALATEFDVPLEEIRQDLSVFCQELISRGLLAIESG